MNAILGLQKTLGISGAGGGTLGIFPAGLILPYGGDTAPTGSLLCDGAAYPRSTKNRLFVAIGTRYGAPDGASFNVPDLRGRFPAGLGPNAAVNALGKGDAAALGNRSPIHAHGPYQPGSTDGSFSSGSGTGNIVLTDHGVSGSVITPTSGVPVDSPSFLVVNFIIVE